MDEDTTEYIIEEIEYVDYEDGVGGIEIIETQEIEEPATTSKNALMGTVNTSGATSDENLIEELIGGEITLSEYDKEGAETGSDTENVSDADEAYPSTSMFAAVPARPLCRSPSVKECFENELDRSRKDAMRGLLQGRDELRDGRQRRRCILPAALQGKAHFYLSTSNHQ